jgi:hypothetical protein
MAAQYTIVTQYPGIDVLGGTQTQDVVYIGFVTIPNGTYAEAPVNALGYSATTVALTAESWANAIEEVWDHPFVVGVQWTEVVNQSNQLVPSVIVTVSSSSGDSAAQVTIPMAKLPANAYGGQIDNLHSQLDAAEAS